MAVKPVNTSRKLVLVAIVGFALFAVVVILLAWVTLSLPEKQVQDSGIYLPDWDCKTQPSISKDRDWLYLSYTRAGGRPFYYQYPEANPKSGFYWSNGCPLLK